MVRVLSPSGAMVPSRAGVVILNLAASPVVGMLALTLTALEPPRLPTATVAAVLWVKVVPSRVPAPAEGSRFRRGGLALLLAVMVTPVFSNFTTTLLLEEVTRV